MVAKYSTTKRWTTHTQTERNTHGIGSLLKLTSVYAGKLENTYMHGKIRYFYKTTYRYEIRENVNLEGKEWDGS